MKIWIDGYEANVLQRLGSGEVAFELLKQFEKVDRKNSYTVLVPSTPLHDLPQEREGFVYKILKPKKFWTRITLPWALYTAEKRPDLIFSPTHYIPRFSPVKRVVTIFDLAYLHFPEMFLAKDLWQLKNWTKYSVENADHIITISAATKKDLIDFYKVDKAKITVAYPGFDSELYNIKRDEAAIKTSQGKYQIKGDYIIYIGTLQPRKNLNRLIEAFRQINNLKLVIVGKIIGLGRKAWMNQEILEAPGNLGIEDKIIFTDYVSTEDKANLIKGAKALILPSLYEGFGIPVLEAMACGVPAIVSNVSSLPEIVRDAGLLIDPYSVEQIEQAIRTITTDKKLHARLSKLSLKRAEKFSWEKMARTVIKVFEGMINK